MLWIFAVCHFRRLLMTMLAHRAGALASAQQMRKKVDAADTPTSPLMMFHAASFTA